MGSVSYLDNIISYLEEQETASHQKLKQSQERVTQMYRDKPDSRSLKTEELLSIYLHTRLPATYAALRSCLQKIPTPPKKILDLGAGPGTGLWGCLDHWGETFSYNGLDHHADLLQIAKNLKDKFAPHVQASFSFADILTVDAPPSYDLIICSYVLNEVPLKRIESIIGKVLSISQRYSLFVLPGTPRDFEILKHARALISAHQNVRFIAPCPHQSACPLTASDWCHFEAPLKRRSFHRLIKKATLTVEQEPFCYLLVENSNFPSVSGNTDRKMDRVIKAPRLRKGHVLVDLCTQNGTCQTVTLSRTTHGKRIKDIRWGDLLENI